MVPPTKPPFAALASPVLVLRLELQAEPRMPTKRMAATAVCILWQPSTRGWTQCFFMAQKHATAFRSRRMHEWFCNGDVASEHQHVDPGWVEGVHGRAPSVSVKFEVQVG
jgi:hypothetical protein